MSQQQFFFFDWHIDRWLGSTTRAKCHHLPAKNKFPDGLLGAAAKGIYRELLDHCGRDGSLPSDIPTLAALAEVSVEVFEMVWPAMKEKFQPDENGRLVNSEMSIRRNAWNEKKAKAKQAAIVGATARWASKTAPTENQQDTCGSHAVAMRFHAPLDISSSFKEEEKNQEEEKNIYIPKVEKETSTFDYVSGFEQICDLYPLHKKGKLVACERAYSVLLQKTPAATHAEIVATLSPGGKWAESAMWNENDGKYMPSLLGFLEERRWKEHPAPAKKQPTPEDEIPNIIDILNGKYRSQAHA